MYVTSENWYMHIKLSFLSNYDRIIVIDNDFLIYLYEYPNIIVILIIYESSLDFKDEVNNVSTKRNTCDTIFCYCIHPCLSTKSFFMVGKF